VKGVGTKEFQRPQFNISTPPQQFFVHTILTLITGAIAAVQPIFGKPKRPYVTGKLFNQPVEALYDTGASISCISEQAFRHIPPDQRPVRTQCDNVRFTSAGGQPLNVRGKYTIPLQIADKTISHDFYVIRNLSEPVILGIDFITQHRLNYCPHSQSFFWKGEDHWQKGVMRINQTQKLEPLSVHNIRVNLFTENNTRPATNSDCIATIASPQMPSLTGGPALIKVDQTGQAIIQVINCAPFERELDRGEIMGIFEKVNKTDIYPLETEYINSVAERHRKPFPSPPPEDKKRFIMDNLKMGFEDKEKPKYVELIMKNHDIFSFGKMDLGRASTLMHEITLKNEEPIYVKQFKIPEAHRTEVEKHVAEWLKLGIIQPTRSKFNSPLFVVGKKDGGVRLVQDFRALNTQTLTDKYSMKDISECIGDIGREGSTIFSTIDLTSGFWQMILHPKSRPYTAFTVPGMGQYQWITSPMGLLGCPASFQRLVEAVVQGLKNVLVYIDDLLVHSHTHDQHREQLQQLFNRFRAHGLKANIKKCVFGSKNVSYLGFRLTEEGIKPGIDKLKAVKLATPPKSIKEIRQFVGLCNFFRTHVRNFAQISAPLVQLTRKDSGWRKGELPPEALQAFHQLQNSLCSEPVVDYPRRNRPYALIVDASLGDEKTPGGLGAILTQIDDKGEFRVISYASRRLQKHEANYTPFLLEMQAAIWGMEHYDTYLRGRHFTLFTDHKPLTNLGKVHTKTLNRLQQIMATYDFEILYKKGSEMPADYLSRNAIDSINWDGNDLSEAQTKDPLIKAITEYLMNRTIPSDPKCQSIVKHYAPDCFIENNIIWRRLKRHGETSRVVIFVPQSLVPHVLQDAHGHILAGHEGIFKTKERILQCYFWPGMDKDIIEHLKACHTCQVKKNNYKPPPALLSPLPQCTAPNQRVHADLFGPLKTSGNQKKYILSITDAFTKYVELVALPNKETTTVSQAIFNRWICRYGVPLEILSDNGTEFRSKLSAELYQLLGITHLTTTARHPQCNAQVEVANKTIAKYLASFVDDSTLDWELYLPPLMFSYNTSFHRSIKTTPYFLTFGQEPRLPAFPAPDLQRKFYGESDSAELYQRLLYAREVARNNNQDITEQYKKDYDAKAAPHTYQVGQLVLLDEYNFLHKNRKLAAKYSGPHKIIALKHDANVELQLKDSFKKTIVHVNRLKPYRVPLPDEKLNFNNEDKNKAPMTNDRDKPQKVVKELSLSDEEQSRQNEDTNEYMPLQKGDKMFHIPHMENEDNLVTPDAQIVKKRGRPRKNTDVQNFDARPARPLPATAQRGRHASRPTPPTQPPFSSQNARGGVLTRAQARQMQHMQMQETQKDEKVLDSDVTGHPFQPVFDEMLNEDVQAVKRGNKKKKKNTMDVDRWSKAQKRNFKQTGDIFGQPLEKSVSKKSHYLNDGALFDPPVIIDSPDSSVHSDGSDLQDPTDFDDSTSIASDQTIRERVGDDLESSDGSSSGEDSEEAPKLGFDFSTPLSSPGRGRSPKKKSPNKTLEDSFKTPSAGGPDVQAEEEVRAKTPSAVELFAQFLKLSPAQPGTNLKQLDELLSPPSKKKTEKKTETESALASRTRSKSTAPPISESLLPPTRRATSRAPSAAASSRVKPTETGTKPKVTKPTETGTKPKFSLKPATLKK
jgi:hypothetical protein